MNEFYQEYSICFGIFCVLCPRRFKCCCLCFIPLHVKKFFKKPFCPLAKQLVAHLKYFVFKKVLFLDALLSPRTCYGISLEKGVTLS